MQRDIEQPALSDHRHPWQPFDRTRIDHAIAADHAQPAGPLGDQHAPVGQEGEAPRKLEPGRERDHPQRATLTLHGLYLRRPGR